MSSDIDLKAEGIRLALELSDAAEQIMRQNLRRRNPAATSDEIEQLLDDWFCKRDQQIEGDWVRRRALDSP
ncbi:MAG: hypothetical protein SX243_18825 [Acidobacteriota bacterium]|nr:hypothetical protein [Acidobacteriota bacterium]